MVFFLFCFPTQKWVLSFFFGLVCFFSFIEWLFLCWNFSLESKRKGPNNTAKYELQDERLLQIFARRFPSLDYGTFLVYYMWLVGFFFGKHEIKWLNSTLSNKRKTIFGGRWEVTRGKQKVLFHLSLNVPLGTSLGETKLTVSWGLSFSAT